MAFVSQNVVLFNGTIAENIAYAQADKFSEEEIINAAKAANAWEFIQKCRKACTLKLVKTV